MELGQVGQLIEGGYIYSVVVCAHVFIVIFFLVVPVLIGVLSWLVPLMLGAADIAFPRINRIGL